VITPFVTRRILIVRLYHHLSLNLLVSRFTYGICKSTYSRGRQPIRRRYGQTSIKSTSNGQRRRHCASPMTRHFKKFWAFIFAPTKRSRQALLLFALIFFHGPFFANFVATTFYTNPISTRCFFYHQRGFRKRKMVFFVLGTDGRRSAIILSRLILWFLVFPCCWHRGPLRVFW